MRPAAIVVAKCAVEMDIRKGLEHEAAFDVPGECLVQLEKSRELLFHLRRGCTGGEFDESVGAGVEQVPTADVVLHPTTSDRGIRDKVGEGEVAVVLPIFNDAGNGDG